MARPLATIVIFTILLNLSAGFMMTAVYDTSGNNVFGDPTIGSDGFITQDNYSGDFRNELEQDIRPSGSVEDEGDQIYRVLDTISLGFIYRFISVVDQYMFGAVNMFDNLFGSDMNPSTRAVLFGNQNDDDLIPNSFGLFKTVLSILYIFMGIKLFTGKDVMQNG